MLFVICWKRFIDNQVAFIDLILGSPVCLLIKMALMEKEAPVSLPEEIDKYTTSNSSSSFPSCSTARHLSMSESHE